MNTNSTEETTVSQESADTAQRRNIQIPDEIWEGISLIAAKTRLSKSAVVQQALGDFVKTEMARLFPKTSSAA